MPEKVLRSAVRRLRSNLARDGQTATDRQLLERFLQEHDDDAFAQLVRRHQRLVQSAIAKVLVDPADIEDAFQATFLVLVRRARSVQWQAGLGTWLYAVAHRVAVHARAAARKRVVREGMAAARTAEAVAAADLSWSEACALLHAEMDKLSDKFRLPLLLCYLEGKSRDEAAEQLGLTAGSVKSRLERGRNLLRDRLARRGVTLSAGLWAVLAHSPAGASPSRLVESAVAGACGAVPARVAALAQGVTASMVLTTIKLGAGVLLAVGLIGGLLTAQSTAPLAASPPLAPAPKQPDGAKPEQAKPAEAPKQVAIQGRVLGPDGKAVPKAKVHLLTRTVVSTETDSDGRFQLQTTDTWGTLVSLADGFGLDWVERHRPGPADEATLQLTTDQPITGAVLDLEGKPVTGARVRVTDLACGTKGDLDDYFEDIARGRLEGRRWLDCQRLPESVGTAITDAQGRFRLTGFGRERVVRAVIEGGGVAVSEVEIFTRPRAVPKGNDGHRPAYPADFKHAAPPTRPVGGVIRDRDTGKPIAGAVVRSEKLANSEYHGRWLIFTKTDAEGRYRMVGLPRGDGNKITVISTGDVPYLAATVPVPHMPGTEPITLDIRLKRGVWAECHVAEGAKGKPVLGSQGQYFAEPGNPYLDEVEDNIGAELHNPVTFADKHGVLRVAALPGKGLIAVRVGSTYLTADQLGEDEDLDTRPYSAAGRSFNAFARFDAAKDAGTVKLDVPLQKGETIPGKLIGPDGKPVTGAWMCGQDSWSGWRGPLESAGFQLKAFSRAHPRFVAVTHPEKGLAAVVQVAAGQESINVQMLPAATVSGQIVDLDGKPRAGVRLEILHRVTPTSWVRQRVPEVKTDAEGRFRIPGLLPGIEYEIREPDKGVVGGGKLKSGETRDLGAVKVTPKS